MYNPVQKVFVMTKENSLEAKACFTIDLCYTAFFFYWDRFLIEASYQASNSISLVDRVVGGKGGGGGGIEDKVSKPDRDFNDLALFSFD